MKVVVDDKIPFIRGIIETMADEVIYLPGKEFSKEIVHDADALITRTRTRCNKELLDGSKVKFIGTATIGFDHIDTLYCKEKGISWSNCPGCNAGSVEQYLHSTLLLLQKEKEMKLDQLCLGIVGVGHVGSRIQALAHRLGMRVIANDPPRTDNGEEGFDSIATVCNEADIITFHTPLIREGKYRTFHLADDKFFKSLKRKPIIINTSRGEVVETAALNTALNEGLISDAVIDVWENEPDIDLGLLNRIFIGTPHIAGYSADGKANATRMVLTAFCRFFHLEHDIQVLPPHDPNGPYSEDENIRTIQKYNPHRDCDALCAHPENFEQLRGDYPIRRE